MVIEEYVYLNSEAANYIRSKFVVISSQLGSTLATSYVWIKRLTYGFDSQVNCAAYGDTLLGTPAHFPITGLTGTLGEYQVVNLAQITPFQRGGTIGYQPMFPLG